LQCREVVAVCCSALTLYNYNPRHLAIVLEALGGLPTDEYSQKSPVWSVYIVNLAVRCFLRVTTCISLSHSRYVAVCCSVLQGADFLQF